MTHFSVSDINRHMIYRAVAGIENQIARLHIADADAASGSSLGAGSSRQGNSEVAVH